MRNIDVVTLGNGSPIVGVLGLCHGDEVAGKVTLDALKSTRPAQGTLKLIYANLAAYHADERFLRSDLNRIFPGSPRGDLEEKTAYALGPHLASCDVVIDIHTASYETPPFTITTRDDDGFDELAAASGLDHHLVMAGNMASGKSLIDHVNHYGGRGISFEAGTHHAASSVDVAREVVDRLLRHLGTIPGDVKPGAPEKYRGIKAVRIDETQKKEFSAMPIRNFALLPSGMPYGRVAGRDLTLTEDCYPVLYSPELIGGALFVAAEKYKSD